MDQSDTAGREDLRVISPEGYESDIGRWIWALEDTRNETLRAVAGLEQAVLDWTPPEGGNSIGTLLYHVALVELDWLFAEVLELPEPWPSDLTAFFPAPARDGAGQLSAVAGDPLGTHLDRLGRVRGRLLAVFREMDSETFLRPRCLPRYDVTPEWVLHHLIQHEAEHRGHIGLLRARATGENPPG